MRDVAESVNPFLKVALLEAGNLQEKKTQLQETQKDALWSSFLKDFKLSPSNLLQLVADQKASLLEKEQSVSDFFYAC